MVLGIFNWERLNFSRIHVQKEGDFMDADEVNDSPVIRTLIPDPMKQEPLLVENIPDPLEGEQTWPTEAEMAEADRVHKEKKQKKRSLPRGTSEYQAAWIVDDSEVSGSDSDDEDGSDNGMVVDEGEQDFTNPTDRQKFGLEDDQASLKLGDSDDETEAESMMMNTQLKWMLLLIFLRGNDLPNTEV